MAVGYKCSGKMAGGAVKAHPYKCPRKWQEGHKGPPLRVLRENGGRAVKALPYECSAKTAGGP